MTDWSILAKAKNPDIPEDSVMNCSRVLQELELALQGLKKIIPADTEPSSVFRPVRCQDCHENHC